MREFVPSDPTAGIDVLCALQSHALTLQVGQQAVVDLSDDLDCGVPASRTLRRRRGARAVGLFRGPMIVSRPAARVAPSTAATAPCGSERSTEKGRSPGGSTTPPSKTPRTPSTCSAGQWERLSSVRFRTRPPSRRLSRSRMAGGEERLGTVSMYLADG